MCSAEDGNIGLLYELKEVDFISLGDVADEIVDSDVVDFEVGTFSQK